MSAFEITEERGETKGRYVARAWKAGCGDDLLDSE